MDVNGMFILIDRPRRGGSKWEATAYLSLGAGGDLGQDAVEVRGFVLYERDPAEAEARIRAWAEEITHEDKAGALRAEICKQELIILAARERIERVRAVALKGWTQKETP